MKTSLTLNRGIMGASSALLIIAACAEPDSNSENNSEPTKLIAYDGDGNLALQEVAKTDNSQVSVLSDKTNAPSSSSTGSTTSSTGTTTSSGSSSGSATGSSSGTSSSSGSATGSSSTSGTSSSGSSSFASSQNPNAGAIDALLASTASPFDASGLSPGNRVIFSSFDNMARVRNFLHPDEWAWRVLMEREKDGVFSYAPSRAFDLYTDHAKYLQHLEAQTDFQTITIDLIEATRPSRVIAYSGATGFWIPPGGTAVYWGQENIYFEAVKGKITIDGKIVNATDTINVDMFSSIYALRQKRALQIRQAIQQYPSHSGLCRAPYFSCNGAKGDMGPIHTRMIITKNPQLVGRSKYYGFQTYNGSNMATAYLFKPMRAFDQKVPAHPREAAQAVLGAGWDRNTVEVVINLDSGVDVRFEYY